MKHKTPPLVVELLVGAVAAATLAWVGWQMGWWAGDIVRLQTMGWGSIMWGGILGLAGLFIGSFTSVILTGNAFGIQGNHAFAFVGALFGLFLLITAEPFLPPLEPILLVSLSSVLVTVCTTIGYNIGAKMKDTGQPASLPWTLDLPMLSLEF